MTINYIYDTQGKLEYAVVPIQIWETVQSYLPKNVSDDLVEKESAYKKFEPKDYFGMLSHLNLDAEQELSNMRAEWTRNF